MKWDCIFRHNDYLQVHVNPHLQIAWMQDGRDGDFPFAAVQRIWRRWHCSVLNPYGCGPDGVDCPYTIVECTDAYQAAMLDSLDKEPRNFVGYIKAVARSRGLARAENKPLPRDVRSRTDGHERATGLRIGARPGPVDDLARDRGRNMGTVPGDPQRGVHRTPTGFSTAGDVLRSDDLRSRPRPRGRHQGETGEHFDGDGCVDL